MKRRALALACLALAIVTGACSSAPTFSPEAERASKPAPGTRASGVIVTPSGVVAPLLSTFGGGSWVRTPCFNTVAVHGGKRIDTVDIVLDPGHGGPET